MAVNESQFYDANNIAIVPMGFCYPGKGKSGDLPPRPECAAHWRHTLLSELRNIRLTLVIGRYAQAWHLPTLGKTVTETVSRWQEVAPNVFPLPHPSPRNQRWFKQHPWFAEQLLPELKRQVALSL